MKVKYLILGLSLISISGFAQDYETEWDYDESVDSSKTKAILSYVNTNRVDDLLDKKRRINKELNTIKAFRIQIYSGSRSGSTASKDKFSKLHPNILVETSYEQPYFKTKVAAYRTRLEAQRALNKYKAQFKGAFIFEENISINKL